MQCRSLLSIVYFFRQVKKMAQDFLVEFYPARTARPPRAQNSDNDWKERKKQLRHLHQ